MDEDIEDVDVQAEDECKPSLLLTLPAEIRNLIFAYVLTNHHIHLRYAELPNLHWSIPRSGYFYHHLLDRDRPPPFPSEIALRAPARNRDGQMTPVWRVCKQLYVETLYLPFCQSNVFSFGDSDVFANFVKRVSPDQVEGIRKIWVVDDNQSAMYMEVLGRRLAEARVGSRLCDMTVYIQSRVKRMVELSNDPYSGPLSTYKTLRAGWDLAFERKMVSGLREIWEKLVEQVIVKEI